ncbi:hypothetical protein TG4357_03353 [Thalassovita gelatinovora]|uniref:Uncharacterized protein n=1 Tax=Thalassovita gelatinovora TaxID=53501 RepID=A0A0N7LW40_THAGE|nr:hypothetical protein [Thalassovita gelatinovora]QIZ81593.1 hypothetical protein HFZ77_14455 [Thalassovita gelatinovora]CUH68034.1 hypothetical protein TG4357_03353 [Thalassovita gelatinovora]SEQ27965.1 hypothetical protein SAMN04488043_104224 [Thalassovita gelatinovora]
METDCIVELAEAFASHCGLKLSTVSTYAANDGKWLDGLKGNASCTLRKASVVIRWFSDNWPSDLEWPADIPRPKKTKQKRAA